MFPVDRIFIKKKFKKLNLQFDEKSIFGKFNFIDHVFYVDVSCNVQLENINLIDKTVVSFNIIQFTKKKLSKLFFKKNLSKLFFKKNYQNYFLIEFENDLVELILIHEHNLMLQNVRVKIYYFRNIHHMN